MNEEVFAFGIDNGDPEDIVVGDVIEGRSGDVITASDEPTILAQLRTTLAKSVKREDVLVEVPERPGMVIRYSPNITQHQIKAWRRGSGDGRKDGLDAVRFSCHVLANTCTGFFLNGVEVTEGGESVTFSHESIMKMVEAPRVFDCVREVYGLDPHVESAALAVLDAAGFNDDVEQVDPTKTP
jgi:hypothetical protein